MPDHDPEPALRRLWASHVAGDLTRQEYDMMDRILTSLPTPHDPRPADCKRLGCKALNDGTVAHVELDRKGGS